MLQLLKKNSEKPGVSLVPAWHPNFRNFERLPDTKVVRTSFFVNGVAVSVALALGLYVISNEYKLHELKSSTGQLQAQIDEDKPVSDRALAQYTKYKAEETKINELKEFVKVPLVASKFVLDLGESIPSGIKLTLIDYKPGIVVLNATIEGAPDEASGRATAYVEKLRKTPAFEGLFESIGLDGVTRNTDSISIKVSLKFKGAAKAAAPTKGAQK